jgi:hypothetical protein
VTEQKKQTAEENKKDQRKRSNRKRRENKSNNQATEQNFNQKLRELVKKYKGFDPWEKEHKSVSDIERAVCRYLDNNGLEHKHRTKRFNVVLPSRKAIVFEPDILIPHPRIQERPILIQAIHGKNQAQMIPLLAEFKKQLGSKYYIVAVTKKDNLTNVPTDICDLLVAVEYASSLPSQLRSQAE